MQFLYSCVAVHKISTDSASRGSSVIAELLVHLAVRIDVSSNSKMQNVGFELSCTC